MLGDLNRSTIIRGEFSQVTRIDLPDGRSVMPTSVVCRFAEALPDTFAEFDRVQRGDALNTDLYGFDPGQGVAIIQIRHAFRRYRNGYMNVRKDYVLAGQNEETDEFFRHPVSAHAIHAAIRNDSINPVAAVRAAQRWMWDVSTEQLQSGIRQGDVLIVPSRSRPAGSVPIDERVVVVAGTHEVHASEFARDKKGRIYAKGPTLRHIKGQHAAAFGDGDGWHAIRVANEAPTWEWGTRLGD